MKRIRLIIAALLTLALTVGMFAALGGEKAQAATKKPAKAKVTANANDDGTSVTLTIAKTKNAEGYKIMVKKPGASKFTKLTTLKKDGTAARTYTAKELEAGEYQFKVRAYRKNGSKTVWGKYSKVVKVTIGKNAGDDKKDNKDAGKSGDPDKMIGYGTATKLDLSKLCGTYTDEAGGTFRIEAVDGGYQVVDVDHLANSYLVSHLLYGADYNFSDLPLYDGLTEYLDKGAEGMISLPTFTEADFKFVEPDYTLYPNKKPHYELSKQVSLSDTVSAYAALTIGTDSVNYSNTVTVYGEYMITKAFGLYYCQATQRK